MGTVFKVYYHILNYDTESLFQACYIKISFFSVNFLFFLEKQIVECEFLCNSAIAFCKECKT